MYRSNGTLLDGGINSNTRLRMVVGAGRLGNGMDGASPLDGTINAMKVINTSDETVFTLGFDENNSEGTRTRFSNADSGGFVDCASTSTCPSIVAGATNEGVSLDGVDDYLPLTTVASHNAGTSGSISFNLKLAALPASSFSYLLDNNCSSADGTGYCLRAYIESSGAVGAGLVSRSGSVALSGWTSGVANGFANKLGSWVTVKFSWTLASAAGSASTFKISITHNGVTTETSPSGATTGTYWPLITTDSKGRFGARVSGNNPLKAALDDLKMTSYNVSFDQQDFSVEQVNRVNAARVAACAAYYSCPTASAAGKFGSALSFDGLDDYLRLDRTIADDFTIAFWMKTTQSGWATAWWDGYGLIDGEVAGWANDFGLSLGSGGQVLFGTGSATGLHATVKGGSTADGAWHHVVATRVKQSGAMKLYIDGALAASGTGGTGSLTAPPALRLGMLQTGANAFNGLLDEVVIIPAAIDPDGAKLLMQTTYPIIDVPADFTTFSLGSGASAAVSGEATVSANAVTSEHRLEQVAEAAIELQSAISYPVNDSNYASMPVLMPFEEVPGETTYNNVGYVAGYSQSSEMETPDCYTAIGCPVSGLPGVVGRAAYFDGAADWLGCTYGSALGLACGSNELNVRTVAAWVKAEGGTIADFRGYVGDDGVELDYNSLNVWMSGTTVYRVAIDLPENVWTHVAATIDMTGRTATVYVNGALHGSTSLGASGTFSGSFP
ncbi:MAG TPA: LamG domain-containing protein, partial [Herpetosiphonaceae bacterium]|nr:LamG domain-containing protein [Herpetosiphonaceae bacterium]